jgi:uncharacterized phage protein (TIGR02220 family)
LLRTILKDLPYACLEAVQKTDNSENNPNKSGNNPAKETKENKTKEDEIKEAADAAHQQSVSDVIDYLNLKTKKNFSRNTKSFSGFISGRLNEGRTVDDLKYVIDVKCEEWLNTDMEQYLTPDTLFRPSKFDKYINQKLKNPLKTEEPQTKKITKW